MNTETRRRYAYWRAHGLPASSALSYVRTEQAYAATLARFAENARAERWIMVDDVPEGYVISAALLPDDDYDWGDIEPTEDERANLTAYVVTLDIDDEDGRELFRTAIGGVDAIDLPGYLQRTAEDALAYALHEYLLPEALDWIDTEARKRATECVERAYWAARDTVTVDA